MPRCHQISTAVLAYAHQIPGRFLLDNAAADAYRLPRFADADADHPSTPGHLLHSSSATAWEMTTLLSAVWTDTAAPTVVDLPNH